MHQEALLGLKELVFMEISELQGSWVAVAGVSILAGATTMWSQSFTVGERPSSVSFLWQTFLYSSKCPYYTDPFHLTYGSLAILVLLQEQEA